jgi:endoglucanase
MKRNSSLYAACFLTVALVMSCATGTAAGTEGQKAAQPVNAVEFTRLLGNGINLGNTMEAYGHVVPGIDKEPSAYETLWGQPITTPEMLKAMKEHGFDSIRIPVAWTNTMNYEEGDFTISKAYLDRVAEIVNYALDAGMRVIVNDHWDGGWWGMFGSADPSTREKAMALYVSMWTQIGERFKDYSDWLVFESANEELGDRLNETSVAKDSGKLKENERYQAVRRINQAFVDTIRGLGGNNADRFLLIAGYDTNIDKTVDTRFKMPLDTAKDRLLVSVHYYGPWSLCGTESTERWGSVKDYTTMNETLAKMKVFVEQGYGVVIGEYGVLPYRDGSYKKDTVDYHRNLLDLCDLYDYAPMLWDCSSFFIRRDLAIKDADLAALYKGRNNEARAGLSIDEIKAQAKASLAASLERAKAFVEEKPALGGDGKAVAWIMYSSSDWNTTYSVGDVYNPASITKGVVAQDAEIEGPGTYTVSLDFTGTSGGAANGMVFSAVGISNGELLFPGYLITIKELLINGKPYALKGVPYTTADDKKCTRVNLYNGWVTEVPAEARSVVGNKSLLSPKLIDVASLGEVKSISVTFDYGPKK